MKKILIFYGSYGGGHFSAARNIKEYIDLNYPNTETLMIDCIEYINKLINKLTTRAYTDISKNANWIWKRLYYSAENGTMSYISNSINKLMALKLETLIEDFNPDLIISTHPFSSQMCSILKMKNKCTAKLATILTDYAPHSQWLVHSDFVDYFFVAHEGMKYDLINKNIDGNKIFPTGIPLSNKFLAHYDKEKILSEFNLSVDKKTILFFAGGEYGLGKDTTFIILESLIKQFPNMQIIAIAGKNAKMKNHFESIVLENRSEKTVKVLSYTNKVPELMSVSDLVITKPGGLTTTESLASGLPIIVINPIPGQEEENAEFLENHGVGVWIKKHDRVEEKLSVILNSPEKLKEMKINAKLLSKKNSTKDICTILLNGFSNT